MHMFFSGVSRVAIWTQEILPRNSFRFRGMFTFDWAVNCVATSLTIVEFNHYDLAKGELTTLRMLENLVGFVIQKFEKRGSAALASPVLAPQLTRQFISTITDSTSVTFHIRHLHCTSRTSSDTQCRAVVCGAAQLKAKPPRPQPHPPTTPFSPPLHRSTTETQRRRTFHGCRRCHFMSAVVPTPRST